VEKVEKVEVVEPTSPKKKPAGEEGVREGG
jgi:hypothetical protein